MPSQSWYSPEGKDDEQVTHGTSSEAKKSDWGWGDIHHPTTHKSRAEVSLWAVTPEPSRGRPRNNRNSIGGWGCYNELSHRDSSVSPKTLRAADKNKFHKIDTTHVEESYIKREIQEDASAKDLEIEKLKRELEDLKQQQNATAKENKDLKIVNTALMTRVNCMRYFAASSEEVKVSLERVRAVRTIITELEAMGAKAEGCLENSSGDWTYVSRSKLDQIDAKVRDMDQRLMTVSKEFAELVDMAGSLMWGQ